MVDIIITFVGDTRNLVLCFHHVSNREECTIKWNFETKERYGIITNIEVKKDIFRWQGDSVPEFGSKNKSLHDALFSLCLEVATKFLFETFG